MHTYSWGLNNPTPLPPSLSILKILSNPDSLFISMFIPRHLYAFKQMSTNHHLYEFEKMPNMLLIPSTLIICDPRVHILTHTHRHAYIKTHT